MDDRAAARRRLVEARLAGRAPAPRRAPDPIPARPAGPAPLSSGQAALLYEHRRRPDRPSYNVVHAYQVRGPLDLDRLAAAFAAAVHRHETLRIAFDAERSELRPERALQLVEIAAEPDGFDAIAAREATTRFDLDAGPLVRVTLARLGPDHHGVVLALHHACSDTASLANLWADVDRAYRGESLDDPPTTYADHAVWQAARRTDTDRAYWADHLGPDPRAVRLGFAAPNTVDADGYLSAPVGLPAARLAESGVRPVPFFLAVLAALLDRHREYPVRAERSPGARTPAEVVVGVAASTRDHPAVADLVGYFLTLLPLRLGIDRAATVHELVSTVDAALVAGLAHRHVPYAEIAAALRRRGAVEADPARILFVYDEPHTPSLAGCSVAGHLVHNGVAAAELTVFVRPCGPERFEVSLEWDGERYRSADMAEFATRFAELAEWAAANAGSPVGAAPGPADLEGPPVTAPLEPLPARLSRLAERAPGAIAVRCGPHVLTYGELERRAAALASALAARGVGRGARVALRLGRSVDAVAAIVAVQRLGAAYVPIDPTYPPARQERIVALAQPVLEVLDTPTAAAGCARGEREPSGAGPPTVGLAELLADADAPGSGGGDGGTLATLDDPAYVIFTSGSTGTAHGVPIDHRRLASSTLGRFDHYAEPVQSYLMASSLGFDSSVAGLFWTLAAGGELVLPTEAEAHDVDALARLAGDVTHLLMVPSLYGAVLSRMTAEPTRLRCAIVAGEACPAALVQRHAEVAPAALLSNEYGPTETTVWASAHDCRPGESPVPIGRAAPGVVLRVADPALAPRPLGVAGELLIGGAGLADGYLDDRAATAASFVADPRGGRRFYRSGDLVRRRADGTLEFLGRVDHQQSVGGVRFEPEEVEAALLTHPAARAALVRKERRVDGDVIELLRDLGPERAAAMLRAAGRDADPARSLAARLADEAPGTDLVVAYVEADGVSAPQLHAHVSERLARHLVPAVIELVEHLARNEHGKVDRSALAPPLRRSGASGQRAAGPAPPDGTDLDAFVAAWRHALDDPTLGPDADFFAEGGDSLLAVSLVSGLEAVLGRRVPINALIEGRTPRRMAALVGTPAVRLAPPSSARAAHLVALRAHGEAAPLVILPPGGGNLLVFDPFVAALDERFPVLGFELPGARDDRELPSSIDELCDVYLPQLRAAQPRGPYRFVGWSFGGVAALALAQRLVADGDAVELVAMIDTLVPGLQRAGRARAYLELAREGDLGGVARKLRQMVTVRARLALAERRGRRAATAGVALGPAERNTWLTIRVNEIVERHRVEPYEGRVVFFSAQDTYAWRTTEPWRRLLPNLDIVPIEGTHDGADGLLSAANSARLAAEVAARLT
ncbi:MAG: amino acid adenylation domain-containing protein [Acidimicrobiia bacterium]|nr:amino acid adenylation domain-containing protein [Acidimicrobiia bacterium]